MLRNRFAFFAHYHVFCCILNGGFLVCLWVSGSLNLDFICSIVFWVKLWVLLRCFFWFLGFSEVYRLDFSCCGQDLHSCALSCFYRARVL